MTVPTSMSRRGTSTLTTPGNVYFIQAEIGGLIKIGWASDPDLRLERMQPHSPLVLRLLFCYPGNGRQERELHTKFAAARKHGEWFEPVPALLAHIEACKASAGSVAYEPVIVAPYIPQGRRPPPTNYGSKDFRRRQRELKAERGW
jgi:hypothetical protein